MLIIVLCFYVREILNVRVCIGVFLPCFNGSFTHSASSASGACSPERASIFILETEKKQ